VMGTIDRKIPGFRTGRLWKQLIAIVVYAFTALAMAGFAYDRNVTSAFLWLTVLALGLVAVNAGGARERIILLRSSNWAVAAVGWILFGFLAMVGYAIVQSIFGPPVESTTHQQIGEFVGQIVSDLVTAGIPGFVFSYGLLRLVLGDRSSTILSVVLWAVATTVAAVALVTATLVSFTLWSAARNLIGLVLGYWLYQRQRRRVVRPGDG
jgi:hypothetical protein